jgi:predicted amidohydrolase
MSGRSIAVAQTVPIAGDVDANLVQHLELAHAAADEGAALLVFPELSLTGYEIESAPRLAFSETDVRLRPLMDTSASRSIILVVGASVRVGSRLHIGAFVVAPDGTVSLYTKQRLGAFPPTASEDGIVPPAEATVFEPGDRNPLVAVGEHRAAVAICADTGRPAHAQAAVDRGVTIYLASMFVIPSEFDREIANLQTYAAQHAMVVAFANYGARTGGLASAGRSAIWSEKGERLIQLPASGAGAAIAIEGESGWGVETIVPVNSRARAASDRS